MIDRQISVMMKQKMDDKIKSCHPIQYLMPMLGALCCFMNSVSAAPAEALNQDILTSPNFSGLKELKKDPIMDAKARVAMAWSLEQCLNYAREHSREFQQTRLDYAKVEEQWRQRRAELDPTLSSSVSKDVHSDQHSASIGLSKSFYGGWNLSTSLTGSGSDPGQDTVSTSLVLTKELLKSGSISETKKALDDQSVQLLKEGNVLNRESRSLVLRIKRLFFRALRNMETLSIQERRLERSRKNLERALEREDPMDIATAKLEVPSSELSVLSSKINIQAALDELKVAMGMDVKEDFSLLRHLDFKIRDLALDEDISKSLNSHENLLNLDLDLKLKQRHLQLAKRGRLPRLWIKGELGHSSVDGFKQLKENEESLSLNLSYPVFHRSAASALNILNLELNHLQLDVTSAQQNKVKTLKQLHRQLREQRQSIDLQVDQVALREQQVELYKDRWNEGEIDILEVVRNENNLENSRVDLVNRKIRYMELLAEYEFERG
jgi:outer membrane protein